MCTSELKDWCDYYKSSTKLGTSFVVDRPYYDLRVIFVTYVPLIWDPTERIDDYFSSPEFFESLNWCYSLVELVPRIQTFIVSDWRLPLK